VLLLLRNEFMTGTTIDVDGGALLPCRAALPADDRRCVVPDVW
jgi:hypothetical protein